MNRASGSIKGSVTAGLSECSGAAAEYIRCGPTYGSLDEPGGGLGTSQLRRVTSRCGVRAGCCTCDVGGGGGGGGGGGAIGDGGGIGTAVDVDASLPEWPLAEDVGVSAHGAWRASSGAADAVRAVGVRMT